MMLQSRAWVQESCASSANNRYPVADKFNLVTVQILELQSVQAVPWACNGKDRTHDLE